MTPHLFPMMGAKGSLAPIIMPVLRRLAVGANHYAEPFVGSAAIGLRALADFASARHRWNDLDPAIIALWRDVRDRPHELIAKVRNFVPSVEQFYRFRTAPPDGFRRLAIAYMAFSGNALGCRGGRAQHYERVDELWNPERIARKIKVVSAHMRGCAVEIRNADFATVLADVGDRTLVFLDPPYLGVQAFYGRRFDRADHQRLADLLGETPARWLLTIGDHHPEVRRLYRWAHIDEIGYRTLLIRSVWKTRRPGCHVRRKNVDFSKA